MPYDLCLWKSLGSKVTCNIIPLFLDGNTYLAFSVGQTFCVLYTNILDVLTITLMK